MTEQHEVDVGQIERLCDRSGRARLMLVDDGIRPFDLEVIAKELPVVGVVVDDQEAQGVRTSLEAARHLHGVVLRLLGAHLRVAPRLGRVRANHLERVEIGAAHVARHVLAREARRVEARRCRPSRAARPRRDRRDPDRRASRRRSCAAPARRCGPRRRARRRPACRCRTRSDNGPAARPTRSRPSWRRPRAPCR